MANLKVSLENIIPLTEARDHFSQIVAEVQRDKLYVLTKGGKPAVAIIDVKYLESLSGGQIKPESIENEIQKAPEKVGRAPMIEHAKTEMPKVTAAPNPFSAQNNEPMKETPKIEEVKSEMPKPNQDASQAPSFEINQENPIVKTDTDTDLKPAEPTEPPKPTPPPVVSTTQSEVAPVNPNPTANPVTTAAMPKENPPQTQNANPSSATIDVIQTPDQTTTAQEPPKESFSGINQSEDKPGPAQYSGEKDDDVADMALD